MQDLRGLRLWLGAIRGRFGWTFSFGFFQTVTGYVQLDDHRVVDQPIDRRSSRHRILEDLFPLRERQVAA